MNWKPHSSWAKIKWRDSEKGFQREIAFNASEKTKAEIAAMFIETQESFINDLPDGEAPNFPFITGNLHDSIVGVVSDNGVLIKASYARRDAVTTSKLSGKQIYAPTSGGGRKRIIGHQEAWRAVYGLQGKYPGRLAVSLIVAVPYALNPNEHGPHMGYLDNLRLLFAASLDAEFRRAALRHVIEWKGNMSDFAVLSYDPDDARMIEPPKRRGRPKNSGSKYMGTAKPTMGITP